MKVSYTTSNGRLNVELEADTHISLWAQLASFQEAFEEEKCQKCNGTDLRFSIRKSSYIDKDTGKEKPCDYHELRCRKCGAKLAFGVLDDQTYRVYPKRKNRDGTIKGKYGWVKWNPETEKEE